MYIFIFLLLLSIGFGFGYFYGSNSVHVIQKQIDDEYKIQTDRLRNEIQELTLSKQYAIQGLQDAQEQAKNAADIFYQQRIELATNRIEQDIDALEERYNTAMDVLERRYNEAEEQYKENYLDTLNDLQASYADIVASKQEEVCKINYEILAAKDVLTDLRDKASAATASNRLAAMSKDEKDFYRCVISDQSISEILQLRKIEPYLHDKRPLCKVIWESYYRDSCSALLDRLVGSERVSGIYKITNLNDNRTYVGQAVNIADRLKTHIKAGIGIDPTNNKMYADMKKLGVENFSFEIVEKCPTTKLNEREKYWISFYDCQEFGYNLTKGGS